MIKISKNNVPPGSYQFRWDQSKKNVIFLIRKNSKYTVIAFVYKKKIKRNVF